MKNRTFFFLLFLLNYSIDIVTYAQSKEEIDKVRARFPDATAIILKRVSTFKVFMFNDTVRGEMYSHDEVLINKEAGLAFQKNAVATSNIVEASDLKAYTLIPDRNKYKKKKVTSFELKDDPQKNVFYDDQKQYSFTYPSAQIGAILTLDYKLTYHEPRLMGNYFWANYQPIIEDQLQIEVQKGITINYKLFNVNESEYTFTKEDKKNMTIYTWIQKDKKPMDYYQDAPDIRYYEPHMVFYVCDYVCKHGKKQLLGSPKQLCSWYKEIQKKLNTQEDARLKQIADSLVAGQTDEWEKVKKIFYWVQDNISYVAFEDGLGGYIPRDAGTVCNRRYGDCKDMASIINEMLRLENIKSYLTWIGSRDIPYTYSDVPTPLTDNHMITSYKDKNNNWIFLDGTGKKAAIETYTSFIQGKQALIGITPDSALLVTVPVKDTSFSQTIDSVKIEINQNTIQGFGTVHMTGYDGLNYYYNVSNRNKDKADEFFRSYFAKGNNKTQFTDIKTNFVERGPVSINYKFTLPDYITFNQNEAYLNLTLDKDLVIEKAEAGRTVPISMKHKTKRTLVTTMLLPSNYKVESLPQNTKSENDIIGYNSTYEVKGNTLVHTFQMYINALIIYPADFSKYNNVIAAEIKASNQSIAFQLK